MKSLRMLLLLPLIALCGCPLSSNQQQQILKASDDAALIIATAQTAETAAAKQGLISDADHQFIETQFNSVANIGKTVDSCVSGANDKNATIACIATAINSVDVINQNGGLYLKSAQAKNDFTIAIAGVRTTLASIDTMLGGTAPPVPVTTGGGQ